MSKTRSPARQAKWCALRIGDHGHAQLFVHFARLSYHPPTLLPEYPHRAVQVPNNHVGEPLSDEDGTRGRSAGHDAADRDAVMLDDRVTRIDAAGSVERPPEQRSIERAGS